jgi:hypothetical protein
MQVSLYPICPPNKKYSKCIINSNLFLLQNKLPEKKSYILEILHGMLSVKGEAVNKKKRKKAGPEGETGYQAQLQ